MERERQHGESFTILSPQEETSHEQHNIKMCIAHKKVHAMIFIEMMLKGVYLENSFFNVLIFNCFLCPLHKPTQIGKSPHKLNSIVKLSTCETGQKDFRPFFPPILLTIQVYFVLVNNNSNNNNNIFKSIKKYITIAIILCTVK